MMPNNIECSFTKQLVQPEPNGNIGGPLLTGVVVATAWLTVGATALYYLFAVDPKQNLSSNEGDDDGNVSGPAPNSVDVAISRLGTHIAELPIVGRFHGKFGWQKAFAKSILTICDVQTLVGLSLLVGGFLALSAGISAYHFILIVQTAWFSHVAQLTTLSILRHTKHNLIAKWARLLITAIFTGLLIRAIIPTIFFGWAYFANFYYNYPDYNSLHNFPGGSASLPGSHAVCYFDLIRSVEWHYENGNNAWNFTDTPAYGSGVASVVFVILNLVVRFLRLQGWLDFPARAVRQWVSKWWKSLFAAAAERESIFQQAVAHIGLTTLLTARLYSDLAISVLSDVYWLVVPTTWGTITLIRARSAVQVEDNKWTYEQILPVLLLLGALSIAVGSFLLRETPVPLRISEETQRYSDAGTSTDNLPTASTSYQETTPLFHREVAALFERDYSNLSTGPWMSAAIALPCLHAAVFTAFFFRYLYDLQPNALSLVLRFIVPVLVGIPSSSFLFILLSLGYQKLVTSENKDVRVYWVMMGFVWAATGGIFSGFLFLHHFGALAVLDFVVLGVGAVIVLVNVLAVVVSKSGDRTRGAISI